MITYKEFLTYGIDLSPLGLLPPSEHFVPYFCTPKNYSLIGSLGVDGIHFCHIKRFGETVFIVTPMGDLPYCFPVARNFDHFLRLLLAVGDVNVMEYLHAYNIENLIKYKNSNPPTDEAKAVLEKLSALGLDPLPEPCEYSQDIFSEYDPSRVRFTDEYYDIIGEDIPTELTWSVDFGDNKKYPAAETRCDVSFSWRGRDWVIPAYHISKKGIAVDICTSIKPDVINEFVKRAEASSTEEESDYLSEISPTNLHFLPGVTVDGKPMNHFCTSHFYYSPDESSGFIHTNTIGELAVEHYGLNPDVYWIIVRSFFDKTSRTSPKYENITLTMNDDPITLPGEKFTVEAPGDTVSLTSPADGKTYTLKALDYKAEELPPVVGFSKFPPHIKALYYSITPEPSPRTFFLRDTLTGDRPVEAPSENNDDFASAIAIIGGADGPTAVMVSKPTETSNYKIATSNPHYEPDFTPVWLPSWKMKEESPHTVVLKA